MCTAVSLLVKDHYFGRNLDLEYTLGEEVVIMPRTYPLSFRKKGKMENHYGIIGIAHIPKMEEPSELLYPLFYDAVNEKGLGIAGLNFPGNAAYQPYQEKKDNITPFELIPWILGQCATVAEAKKSLQKINILNENFSEALPLSPLHWMISDRKQSLVVEPVEEGVKLYENPVGVLTNNPTFDKQLFHLNNYMHLSNENPKNTFSETLNLQTYSRGMGALGLPGDWSSQSRFVRAAFAKFHSKCEEREESCVYQFFHILSAVEHLRGCVDVGNENYEITQYSCCCNTDRGIYYYRTYENSSITAVSMDETSLNGRELVRCPIRHTHCADAQDIWKIY